MPTPPQLNLALAVPFYGTVPAQWMKSLLMLRERPPCNMRLIEVIGDSLVARARNTLTHIFLQSDSTHLLFLDSDVIIHPDHIARLISHDLQKYPLICGLYPKKRPDLQWVCNGFEAAPLVGNQDGLAAVKYAGTGCMLIARTLLEQIMERWPQRKYVADSDETHQGERYDFFPCGPRNLILPDLPGIDPGKERYLSEDWAFCEMTRALGHPVMVDPQIQLQHLGTIAYPIDHNQTRPPEEAHVLNIASRLTNHIQSAAVIDLPADTTNTTPLAGGYTAVQPLLDIISDLGVSPGS